MADTQEDTRRHARKAPTPTPIEKPATGLIVGYARTSTRDQVAGFEEQIKVLQAAGAAKMFSEQVSSVAHRAQLDACLGFLRDGDVLMVTKPDRLARSVAHLLQIVGDLDRRGVGLVILSMGGERLDTRNPTARLMLTILAGVSAWEREIMLERQAVGIAKAKADGRYEGRPRSFDPEQIRQMAADGMTAKQIAKALGCHRAQVYRGLSKTKPDAETAPIAVAA